MEHIYSGSDGVTTQIFGFDEALAALAGAAPAPAPPPAGSPRALTLTPGGVSTLANIVNGDTFITVPAAEAVIDVSAGSAIVGTKFSVVLTNVGALVDVVIGIRLVTGGSFVEVTIVPASIHTVLDFRVLAAGAVAMDAPAFYTY